MNEDKIQELLKSLFNLKYNWEGYKGDNYTSDSINKDARLQVEMVIRSFLLDNRDSRAAELEAKVFMYEQIISKSNFAPMLSENKDKEVNNG